MSSIILHLLKDPILTLPLPLIGDDVVYTQPLGVKPFFSCFKIFPPCWVNFYLQLSICQHTPVGKNLNYKTIEVAQPDYLIRVSCFMFHVSESIEYTVVSPQSVANTFSDERIQIWILFAKDIFYKYKYEYCSWHLVSWIWIIIWIVKNINK